MLLEEQLKFDFYEKLECEELEIEEETYETPHFLLKRKVYRDRTNFYGLGGVEDIEFIVLDPNDFDLVQPIGFGITNPKHYEDDLAPYIRRLKIARTESEKDEIFYELYFVITNMVDILL